ncbi:glycoside hydrolase family 3 C-terminal domain-containing protein [Mariniflexile gromovii]|uniref:Glycoside hydrolase family 3 C-terminal domain-containing protein n=1 Tax=Mariniflexile gromovii TaxID=362523 RepID=A0ABS4BWH7_9FLAO|nr:glycoside hydrolase family 3 protein [Mariniflexile gromovii]MBP0904936.1 glycoside hydrolase family 3 C-terminal domain-containing protein [Mariniflexile gromovii]
MKLNLLTGLLILIVLSASGQSVSNANKKFMDTSLDFETRSKDLVSQMTLDEKIAQLGDRSPAIPRLGVPEYNWWNECLHGVARSGNATVFPQAIGMAATFDTAMMTKVADIISDEARAKYHEAIRNKNYGRYFGLTFWSPNINILRDPRWGRGHETYGEDPYLTGQMGMQFVKGLQGDDSKYMKLVATPKHFAVHNGPEPERHVFNVTPNTRDLWETYLPAFEDLVVDAKAYSIMGAYNRVDGESSCASWLLLEDILRNKWGFKGYVVSDCGAIRDIHKFHKIVNTPEEAAAIGVRKGCDLNCGSVYQTYLKNAVALGLIDEGEIDLSVYRLVLAKMKLGMFDKAEDVPFANIPIEVNNSEPHNQVALEMAQKSMTLLKNNGVLPLNKSKISKIAVVGPNADNINALRGNYYGTASNPVSVIEGIRKAAGNDVEISYSQGISLVTAELVNDKYNVIDGKYLFTTNKNGKQEQGLTGTYYRNRNLKEQPVFQRIDPEINFEWSPTSSPTTTAIAQGILTEDKAIDIDRFSISWSGKLLAPETGKYILGVESDDGNRLWVDGKPITDAWHNNVMATSLAEIHLEKGQYYDIKLDYFENMGNAKVKLVWVLPSQEDEAINTNPYELSDKTLTDVKNADVAVFVGGLDATWEGEEMKSRTGVTGFNVGDRTTIELPEIQLNALKAMKKTGTPIVFVLMSGGSIACSGLEDELDAMLMAWYPGQRGGDAVADVLFGAYNPAGRLPVTFYTSTNELADFKDYNMRAGKGFTYRYYTGEALFPFGHGLSYTNFEYSNLSVNKKVLNSSEKLSVSVKIKNTGKFDGEEVVQLYIKDVKSDTWMPVKQLRKFDRIALKKGETKTISFDLDISKDFRYYNPMLRQYEVEPGDFEIQVGASSKDIRLKKIVTVKE